MKQPVKNHKALRERILHLEEAKKEQEQLLLATGKKALKAISNPAPFIKEQVAELACDKDLRKDLLKLGISAATNYLSRLLQTSGSGKSILSAIMNMDGDEDKEAGLLKNLFRTLLNKIKPTKS